MAKGRKKSKKKTVRRAEATTIRRPSAKLNADDALRIAAADKRFAAELIKRPESFKEVFNLKDAEVAALGDALGPGGLAAATEYE